MNSFHKSQVRLLLTIVSCFGLSLVVSACSVSSDYLPRFTFTVDPPLKVFALEQKPVGP